MPDKRPSILHVDDDEANRYAVTRSLVKAGFDVTEAASGSEALRRVTDKPDLVILDIRLPDIDGFEVCRRIKADPATAAIPVLHLSASLVSSEDKAQGLNGGAEAYLIRPVEPVELVATVKALLRNKATEEALRASEERFALAVESGDLGTFYCPLPLGRMVWNAKCKEHFWLPPDAEVDFDLFYAIIHPDDVDRIRQAVEAAVFGRKHYDVQYRTVAPDARERWVRAKGRGFYDGGGVATRFDGITLDITDQKRTEAERERLLESAEAARAEALHAGRMKDEFLATLGHELRTPLNAILGWSTILRSGRPSEDDLRTGLETIERNARAQTQIIEDLLDMSRIISGKVRLDVRPVDLPEVVNAAVATVKPSADAKGVELSTAIDPAAGPVAGDPSRLQQVFWNLLTNAVKFTPRGGRVRVTLERVGDAARFGVVDSGEGIPAEFLPHVFDRFRQADASTTRRHGGLGLGLSIVRQLVELHGGTVDAASGGAGRGSTFSATLPLVAGATSAANLRARERRSDNAPTPGNRASYGALEGVKVLVVDDERDSREMVRRLLEDAGAVVASAASTAEAMIKFAADAPDVLVSDIGMPGEDGYGLIRRIRAFGSNLPALALTAYARAEDKADAARAGYDEHAAKPVEPAALVATVARLAGRST